MQQSPVLNKIQIENIPAELKKTPHWVLWKYVNKGGKPTKVPYQPNKREAKANDATTWSAFESVWKVYESSDFFAGIGFMLAPPYVGFDTDKSIDYETGAMDQRALNLITTLKSYTEYSPSGLGFHVIAKLSKPLPENRYKKRGNFECYEDKRFFTFTGNVYQSYKDVHIRDEEALQVVNKFFKKSTSRRARVTTDSESHSLTKKEVIALMVKSKNGQRIKAFLNGEWESLGSYPSQSEADKAFLNDLAYWTGKNPEMMDEIYRESGMMRDKWDRKQSGSTYGALEIEEAIASCTNMYEPKKLNPIQQYEIIPYGYQVKNGALYQVSEKILKDGSVEQKENLICSQAPLIIQSFENVETDDLYYELNWKDEHRLRKAIVLASQIGSRKELVQLSNRSLAVTENNAKNMIDYFYSYLMHNKSKLTREHLVSRLGHIKDYFVHPVLSQEVMIKPSDLGEKQLLEAFQTTGTVEEWLEYVLGPIQNHPRALLMVLASFASVLLKDLRMQPFVIDFAGETSNGKTTILRACASVWGTDTLMSEWNITKVAAERKTTFLNSYPLILDDSRKANEKTLGDFIYNFSGGRSKGRGSLSGSQQEFTWTNILISTGEASLTAYAEQKGGVAARIISIEGMPFENVSPSFFTDLHNGIDSFYGEIGKQFVEKWQKYKSSLIPEFSEYVEVCQKKAEGNPVIVRVARNFAVLIFAGKLLNTFFKLDLDLMKLYKLFDELVAENKALDKPKQLLEMLLQDLDSDRGAIFRKYELSRPMKAVYKEGVLWITPNYLKEFLNVEEKTMRASWLKRGFIVGREERGKLVDYHSKKINGKTFRLVCVSQSIIKELGFDFTEQLERY